MDANDFTRHGPGVGGVAVAALLSFRDGWRVVITQAVAGLVMVFVLGPTAAKWLVPFGLSPEAAGFLVGGFGVQAFLKCASFVQQLELAKPANAFIERWTGAKAPKEGGQP